MHTAQCWEQRGGAPLHPQGTRVQMVSKLWSPLRSCLHPACFPHCSLLRFDLNHSAPQACTINEVGHGAPKSAEHLAKLIWDVPFVANILQVVNSHIIHEELIYKDQDTKTTGLAEGKFSTGHVSGMWNFIPGCWSSPALFLDKKEEKTVNNHYSFKGPFASKLSRQYGDHEEI